MKENELYNKLNYLGIIILLFFILILCLIYFSVVIYYIIKNHNKNITVLWIDYCITISIGIIFTILYLIILLTKKNERIVKLKSLYSNKLIISTLSFLLLYFYAIINNLVFDIIKSIEISYKLIKFNKIKDKNLPDVIEKFKKINIMNYVNLNKHYYFEIIINIINFILVGFFIVIYTNIDIQNNFFSLKNHNIYFMKYYDLIVLLILIICSSLVYVLKKCLINNKYYTDNKFIMNIYNIHFKQIVYYIDFLFIKISIDLFVNIPIIYYIALSKFNTIAIIFFEICSFIFVFVGGNILLSIDHKNKSRDINNKIIKPKLLNILFIFKDFHLRFNDNGLYSFMNEYEYYSNLPLGDKKKLSELNINFIEKNEDVFDNNNTITITTNITNNNNTNIYNVNNNKYNLNEIKEINIPVKEKKDNPDDDDNSEFNTSSEFYILYKLLFIFFDKNKDLYNNLLKIIKKNVSRKSKEGDNNNREELLINIEKVKQFSELESKNLNLLLKLHQNDIFKTSQEQELYEEFNQKYKKDKNSKIDFIIESLSQKPLFEIFPFLQIKIENILKALKPSDNINVFKKFLNKSSNKSSSRNSKKTSNKNSNRPSNKLSEKFLNFENEESKKNSNRPSNKLSEKFLNSDSEESKKNSSRPSNKLSEKFLNFENEESKKNSSRPSNKLSEKFLNSDSEESKKKEIKKNLNKESENNLNKININSDNEESKKKESNESENEKNISNENEKNPFNIKMDFVHEETQKKESNKSEKNISNESEKNPFDIKIDFVHEESKKKESNESEKIISNESEKNPFNLKIDFVHEESQKKESNESEKNINKENEKNLFNININFENEESKKKESNESEKNINKECEKNINKININSDNDEIKKGKETTYNNESDSLNNSNESSESNCYYSFNYLIMMEIYNKSDFIDCKQITKLTSSFKEYILEKIKKKKCTFLPLLIGIYNIKFCGKNKIVVLYKNPLYFFTNNSPFNKWIHYFIGKSLKIKKSFNTKNDIIDINEIEEDNIKLGDNEYEEIKIILENDCSYLSKLNFEVFPIIHLFVATEYEYNTEEKLKKNQKMNESMNIGSLGSQRSVKSLLNLLTSSNESNNNSIKRKDLSNSDYNSLIEKEFYTSYGNRDMFTIKIYFSNYFGLANKCNKEEGTKFLLTSNIYINDYLKIKILSYLQKNNLFSNDDNARKPSQTSLEDEKIIIENIDSNSFF